MRLRLMLTAFLAGHALGAAAAARAGRGASIDRCWRALGTAQILAALTALLSLPLLVAIHGPINRVSFIEGMSFWGARIPFHLAISLAVFAPSAFFLGASFTLAARLYVGRGRAVGTSTGRLYGLNTLGAILGAIVTTAWLIPALGTQNAIIVLALLQALQGGAGHALRRDGRAALPRASLRDGSPGPRPSPSATGSTCSSPSATSTPGKSPASSWPSSKGRGPPSRCTSGSTSDRVISINGVNVAGTNPVLRATQKLQAHLPLFLHQAPRSVLQIGFGSGGTCYSVSLHQEVESIDVVELNPDILEGGHRVVRRHQSRRPERSPGPSADRRRQEPRRGHRPVLRPDPLGLDASPVPRQRRALRPRLLRRIARGGSGRAGSSRPGCRSTGCRWTTSAASSRASSRSSPTCRSGTRTPSRTRTP